MRIKFWIGALAVLAVASATQAQEPPKPGPEHEVLKKQVGHWNAVIRAGGMESKGHAVYSMELGGLWLVSSFKGEIGGGPFAGRGLDTYDAAKKKYTAIWVDSMSTTPLMLEGTYDADKKTQTMMGEGPGPDGPKTKFRTVTAFKDDTMEFSLFMGDGKEPAMTISYTRAPDKKPGR